jgi:TonB-linked SusC/RagA family outer membrane protein
MLFLVSLFMASMLVSVNVCAQNVEKKVSISCKDEPLPTILNRIERQSGYKMNFSNDELSRYRVSAVIEAKTAVEAVDQLIKDLPLERTVNGRYIVIHKSKNAPSPTQSSDRKTVKGSVRCADGTPLVGVTILEKGTLNGAITDWNGSFTLTTDNDAILTFSYIGYKSVELYAKDRMDIVMDENVEMLSDVVVTGYQTISRERSAGSFNIVRGEDMKESSKARGSILEGLEGLAPGFSVNLSNDAVSKYLVRGLTSINSSKEPLFVVDGVPLAGSDLESMLSATDVATVTVLKDATAVSIWGSRAANGVVVVVTRSGSNTNGQVNVAYDGNITMKGKIDLDYFNLMDSRTFIKNATERFESDDYHEAFPWSTFMTDKSKFANYAYYQAVYPHERILYDWKNGKISLDERNRQLEQLASQDGYQSYQDEIMTSPWMQNHTISLSGGTEKVSVIGSIGYEGRTGDYHNTDDTYKLNFKQNFKVTKWFNWDILLNASYTDSKSYINPLDTYGAQGIYNFIPYALMRNADGTTANFNSFILDEQYWDADEYTFGISTDFFPVSDFFSSTIKTKNTRVRANTGIQLDLWKGLGYEVRFSYFSGSSNGEQYIPQDTWHIRSARLDAIDADGNKYLPDKGGDFTVNNIFNSDWTVRNQLTYNSSFDNLKHQITALAGCEYRESKTKGYVSFERGYDYQTMSNTVYDINAAREFGSTANYWGTFAPLDYDDITQSEVVLRYVSYYANLAYTFNEKYSINGNVRVDQSNLFGTDVNNQYKPIGSVGLAWNLFKEDFMRRIHWLNGLTLRLGYGHSGNSPSPDAGGPYNIIVPHYHPILGSNSGYVLSTPANRKLSWEKTRTYNVGIDFALLNHRLNGTVDLYHKKTMDLLAYKSLNILTGFRTAYANVGEMENKGVELALNSHNIATKDFNWHTSLSLAYNKNEIVDYYNEPTTSASTMLNRHYVEGYPAGALFALKWAGLRHEDGVAQAFDKDGNKSDDFNTLTAEDTYYVGTVIPKWTGSFTNRFNYKGLELSAMFVFSGGNHLRTDPYLLLSSRFLENRLATFDDRWRQPGDEAFTDVPSAFDDPTYSGRASKSDAFIYQYGDQHIQSASFLKLRELALGYALPGELCSKLYAKNLKVRLAAHNLLRIVANEKGIDPEAFNLYTGKRATNYGAFYSIGLTANF